MTPRSPGEPTISLEKHLAWLESIGQKPGCPCRYAWKSLAWKDGPVRRDPGPGWVRMNTDPSCPEHGK